MSICYIEKIKQIRIETKSTCYQMKIDSMGYLNHLYYGPKTGLDNLGYPYRVYDHGFSGNPYDKRHDRSFSLDSLAQEYTSTESILSPACPAYTITAKKPRP